MTSSLCSVIVATFSLSFFVFQLVRMSEYDEYVSVAHIPPLVVDDNNGNNVTYLNLCITLEDDSYYVSSYNKVAAAVELGINNANLFILPKNVQLRTVLQSAGESCSQVQHQVVTNLLRMLKSGVTCDVFLGAGCATTGVAMYGIAEELNIPIFGCPAAGASALSLNNSRTRYPLLLRMPYGLANFVQAAVTFLDMFNYTNVSVLRDDSYSFYSFMSKYLMSYFQTTYNQKFGTTVETPFTGLGVTRLTRQSLLFEAGNRSRVIMLLTHARIVRQFMLTARDLGMTLGDYVSPASVTLRFSVNISTLWDLELYELAYWGRIKSSMGDNADGAAREAFQCLLVISLADNTGLENSLDDTLSASIKILAKERYNFTFLPLQKPDPVVIGFYESIVVYGQEVNTMMRAGSDFRDGAEMVRRIVTTQYQGITGAPLTVASNGERVRDYEMKNFDILSAQFKTVCRFLPSVNITFLSVADAFWFTNHGQLPPNKPKCGFRNDECREDRVMAPGVVAVVVLIPLLALLSVTIAAGFAIVKLRKLRLDYNPDWWKVLTEDLTVKQNRTGSGVMSKKTLNSQSTAGLSAMSGISGYNCDILASFKNTLVALTDVGGLEVTPTPAIVVKLNLLKNSNHPNLQRFIGIGLNPNGRCQYVIAELCAKGSLTDVLNFSTIKLDWSFKNSLIKDLVFGMTYLHTSPIVSHGNLNAHCCLIDTRFTVKISDYGLPFFRHPNFLLPYRAQDTQEIRNFELLLWRAPELLRQTMPPEGTQKGDVYSFAIILQQIVLRSGPFELPNDPLEMSEQEILHEVVAANIPPVRPRVPRAACSNELYDLMERCWEEIPVERPVFPKIKERLKRVIGDQGDNIVDVLFKRMEQYAMDLELKVAEKTQQFMDEKNRSEQLLSQLLPKSVAAALTRGEHVDPEAYESVTIFFSDIVGFTTIAAAGTPMSVVNLLNSLYTFFDSIIERWDVYKVETIGDAYMVSSGLPVRNGNRHATEIASMSIEILNGIRSFTVPDHPGKEIQVRIGLNSGPCVAGIVGLKMPRYCLFGDTVNVASRMESTGEAMKIQITEETKDLLHDIGGYHTVERGPVPVKGKGMLTTYWLLRAE